MVLHISWDVVIYKCLTKSKQTGSFMYVCLCVCKCCPPKVEDLQRRKIKLTCNLK